MSTTTVEVIGRSTSEKGTIIAWTDGKHIHRLYAQSPEAPSGMLVTYTADDEGEVSVAVWDAGVFHAVYDNAADTWTITTTRDLVEQGRALMNAWRLWATTGNEAARAYNDAMTPEGIYRNTANIADVFSAFVGACERVRASMSALSIRHESDVFARWYGTLWHSMAGKVPSGFVWVTGEPAVPSFPK